MLLTEIYSADIMQNTDKIVDIVLSAKQNNDKRLLGRLAAIFDETPYNADGYKAVVIFTSFEDELRKQLAIASHTDEYFVKRLLRKISEI